MVGARLSTSHLIGDDARANRQTPLVSQINTLSCPQSDTSGRSGALPHRIPPVPRELFRWLLDPEVDRRQVVQAK